MADWPFPPPSPETTGSILSAFAGAIIGSLIRKVKSWRGWAASVFTGAVVSMVAGGTLAAVTGLDRFLVLVGLGICGVPIAHRLHRYAEKSKIGELPALEEEKEA